MEQKDKEYRKLRFGLALKKVMDQALEKQDLGVKDGKEGKSKSLSFRKLETASGIRHATIVEIVNGKKNAAWSTVDALLEGLEIDLTQFASIYDNLTEQEVLVYKKELMLKKQEREKKRKKKSSK
jgi:transcriptional regulator with XRE-family HTH domain